MDESGDFKFTSREKLLELGRMMELSGSELEKFVVEQQEHNRMKEIEESMRERIQEIEERQRQRELEHKLWMEESKRQAKLEHEQCYRTPRFNTPSQPNQQTLNTSLPNSKLSLFTSLVVSRKTKQHGALVITQCVPCMRKVCRACVRRVCMTFLHSRR